MPGPLALQQFGLKGSEAAGQMLARSGQASLSRLSHEIMQSRQLQAMHQRQQQYIDAQSSMKKEAADHAYKMAAVKAGLTDQLKEQEFARELKGAQVAARNKAAQFDYEFSTEQRQELSRLQGGLQAIMESDAFNAEEKQAAQRSIFAKMAGIQPKAIPARGPKTPDWFSPTGISTDPVTKLLFQPSYRNGKLTPEPLPKELQPTYRRGVLEQEEMKAKQAWKDELWNTKIKVVTVGEGGKTTKEVPLDADEIRKRIAARYPNDPDGMQIQQKQQETPESLRGARDEQKMAKQMMETPVELRDARRRQQNVRRKSGVALRSTPLSESEMEYITPQEAKLPPDVARASAVYRIIRGKYGSFDKAPKVVQQEYAWAVKALNAHWGK